MEPNNIENQIKNSLKNRELQPSPKAWDRLDAILAVAEEKKSKKIVFWKPKYFAIAAAFVLIGSLIFMNLDNSEKENLETIVIKEDKQNPKSEVESQFKTVPELKTDSKIAIIETSESTNENTKAMQNKINYSKNITEKHTNHQSKNASTNQKKNQEIAEIIYPKNKDQLAKKESVLAISDSDLLASVDNASKTKNQKTIQVNSKSMLNEVSSEINQEYRETNFQKLKRNFETVKVAISTRNNQ